MYIYSLLQSNISSLLNGPEKTEYNLRYKTFLYTCTTKTYCIFDVFTVSLGHNLLTSFISKLYLVSTQANIHGEVAKIHGPLVISQ